MIKTIKKFITHLSVASLLLVPVLVPAVAHADIAQNLCNGSDLTVTNTGTCDATSSGKVDTLLTNVINIFSIVVGVIAVIMIIIGGLQYITSGGESGKITGAKNTLLYAIIGLIIVALAQIIVKFVINRVVPSG